VRHRKIGNDADRRLPVLLRVHWLRHQAAAEAGRLLRVLFLRLSTLPADASRESHELLRHMSTAEACADINPSVLQDRV
jgi:hypothetical protein